MNVVAHSLQRCIVTLVVRWINGNSVNTSLKRSMAITIIKAPSLYNPALNDSIFQLQTDNVNILYFNVTVTKPDGISILSNLKIYPTPALRNGAYVNLQEVLKNVSQTTILKNDTLLSPLVDIYSYRLNITEYIYNTSNNSVSQGAYLQTSFYNVFNGQLPKIAMSDYDYSIYVSTNISIAKYLTDKPTSNIKYWSTEYLYFMNNSYATGVDIKLYYSNGTSITKALPIDTSKKLNRINISPRALAVAGLILDNLKYYTINLVSGNAIVSQVVTRYYLSDVDCSEQPVNIIWVNSYGGTDSYTFKNPIEKLSVDKVSIKMNGYGVNSAGFYVASNSNIYQSNEQIISVDETSEYTVYSDWLSTAESTWLPSVIASKSVYVELTNGKLLPIKVTNNTASLQNKFSSGMKSFELSFQSESGLLSTIEDRINDKSKVGIIGTSNSTIVLQTADYEYVSGLTGGVRI